MAEKFTSAQVDVIVGTYMASVEADYDARTEVVKELAAQFDVPVASIRGKLVAEKVYKKKEAAASTSATKGVKKEDLVAAFEASFGMKIPSMKNMTVKDLSAFWAKFVEMSAVRDANEGKQ